MPFIKQGGSCTIINIIKRIKILILKISSEKINALTIK